MNKLFVISKLAAEVCAVMSTESLNLYASSSLESH